MRLLITVREVWQTRGIVFSRTTAQDAQAELDRLRRLHPTLRFDLAQGVERWQH
jgi:hypothetical protein